MVPVALCAGKCIVVLTTCCFMSVQEMAEQQQAQLQARLTEVLSLQAQPSAVLGDVESPVSHMVTLIDDLLGVSSPGQAPSRLHLVSAYVIILCTFMRGQLCPDNAIHQGSSAIMPCFVFG